MHTGLHVKYRLLLSDFSETSIFSTDVLKIFKYHTTRKTIRWEPNCWMWTDGGRTDVTKLTVTCRNSAKASKNNNNNFSKWTTWRAILLFYNTFITVLYMFRATSCSSSGGRIVLIQHLVSSLSVSGSPVHRTATYREWRYQMLY